MANEYVEELDRIYKAVNKKNGELLIKSNEDDYDKNTIFEDAILFSISCHAMSYIKNLYLCNEKSIGNMLNARGIIEGMALLSIFDKGKLKDHNIRLFAESWKAIEYKNYKDIENIGGTNTGSLKPVELDKNYQDYLSLFSECFPTAQKHEIKRALSSSLMFLFDVEEKLSFEQIIKNNLENDLLITYKLCSQLVHPHDYGSIRNDELFVPMYINILSKLKGLFSISDECLKAEIGISDEFRTYTNMATENNNRRLFEYWLQQNEILGNVIVAFNNAFRDNFVSNTFSEIRDLLSDMSTDNIFGFNEHAKIKLKALMEIIAVFNELYFDIDNMTKNNEYRISLLKIHTYINIFKNIESANDENPKAVAFDQDEFVKKAFDLFVVRNNVPQLEYESFKNRYANSALGFLITKELNIPQLSELVYRNLDKIFGNATDGNGVNLSALSKMYYKESQSVAHTNGYLFFCNSAVFVSESISVCSLFDSLIFFLLEKTLLAFTLHRTIEGGTKYREIIETLEQSILEYKKTIEDKAAIFKIPRVNKTMFFKQSKGVKK